MIFTETKLKGAYIIDVKRLEDERGFFGRSYCMQEFEMHGLNINVMQANVSYNKKKGTLRGMHMQAAPFGETKLVRCTRGSIYDVIIDMRPDSDTFKQWIGVSLSADNYRMLYVPEGFAHGFITLQDNTDVTYQVTQMYVPVAERAYRWDDPAFNIKWPVDPIVISEKDRSHAMFESPVLA
ncbi:dTDP-4-dehydrorhamnose 3,5-epimerase [Mucilaginibacter litoreus]|uniref:dTDP-4-dehydrorhamnose 3,5-epimerase n=1 Tax=Mucilaginibacter litoreus TaxID=1048221 RepID=A0ABW3AP03_9SPHI